MNCIKDEILHNRLDGELSQGESSALDEHLAECVDCSRRADTMTARTERVEAILSVLAPLQGETPTDARFALARFKARRQDVESGSLETVSRPFLSRMLTVGRAAAVLVIVMGILILAAPQSLADRLLDIFRVRKITVVSVDSNSIRYGEDSLFGRRLSQMLAGDVAVIRKPGSPARAANAKEASALAEFDIRLPGERADAPQLMVEGQNAFQITVDRARLQSILEEVGRFDLQLPASVDGAKIIVDIPKAVLAVYGDCPEIGPHVKGRKPGDWSNCIALGQIRVPAVIAPPDLNFGQVAEIGLQLSGMTAYQAHEFASTVDWTSTLVIPLPREAASYRTVEVDGVKGALMTQAPVEDRPEGYTLLWLRNGVIYSLSGFGDSDRAIALANSLK